MISDLRERADAGAAGGRVPGHRPRRPPGDALARPAAPAGAAENTGGLPNTSTSPRRTQTRGAARVRPRRIAPAAATASCGRKAPAERAELERSCARTSRAAPCPCTSWARATASSPKTRPRRTPLRRPHSGGAGRASGAGEAHLRRLLWLSARPGAEGLAPASLRRRESGTASRRGRALADFARRLKTSISEKSTKRRSSPRASRATRRSSTLPHLRPPRQEGRVPIKRYLSTAVRGSSPIRNEGDSKQLAEYHRENLLTCEPTLIYYGSADDDG